MYPYLHDFFNDIFGTEWRLPFPMFGFWVAMAFIVAHYFFSEEMKRKEQLGLLKAKKEKKTIGEKMKASEYVIQALFGFVLGFKGLAAAIDYDAFVSDPPALILSGQGNWLGGILGAALIIYLKYREVKKQELKEPKEIEETIHPYQLVANMTLIAAISGILGAKIFHNLENIDDFIADPAGMFLSFSGLSIFGGLIVGGFSVVYYGHKKGLKPVHVIDACAPALLLAYGIGRIGCHLSGDGDWGIPNDSPMPEAISFLPEWMWAYDYPNNVLGVNLKADFTNMGLESITGKAWPTPFYETVMAVSMFLIMWTIRKKIHVPGLMFSVYLVMIGVERFFIEKIRINPPYHFFGIEATQAEVISTMLVIIGIIGIIWLQFFKKKENYQQTNTPS